MPFDWDPADLTEDLAFTPATDPSAIDYTGLLANYAADRRLIYAARIALIVVPVLLVGSVALGILRRRRAQRP